MVFPSNGSNIVKSWSGQGTAETYYQTRDGVIWKSDPSIPRHPITQATATGERFGTIFKGSIYPK